MVVLKVFRINLILSVIIVCLLFDRMSSETLMLIRRIGSIIVASPPPETPEPSREMTFDSPGSRHVQRVTRDVERKAGVSATRKRLVSTESGAECEVSKKKKDAALLKPQHLEINAENSNSEAFDMDPVPRPRSPNIHSIEIKSVAIPKEVFVRAEKSTTEKPKAKSPSPVTSPIKRATERKVIIEEKFESMPKCAKSNTPDSENVDTTSKAQSTDVAAPSSSESEPERREPSWDDVKVRELVGMFESKDEAASSSRSPSVTSAPDNMAELGLTFQASPTKTADEDEQCKIKCKRHTWTGGDKPNTQASNAGKTAKRHSCRETKSSQKHSFSNSESYDLRPNQKKTDRDSESKSDTSKSSKRSDAQKTSGNIVSAASRTRTISEPPGKGVKGEGQKSSAPGSGKSGAERKTSLPIKATNAKSAPGDKVSNVEVETGKPKRETPNTSLLRKPKKSRPVDTAQTPHARARPHSSASGGSTSGDSSVAMETEGDDVTKMVTPEGASVAGVPPSEPTPTGAPRVVRTGAGTGLKQIGAEREPDTAHAHKLRKQHGKTHPLTRLTQEHPDPPSKEPTSPGRSPNPFYNTM